MGNPLVSSQFMRLMDDRLRKVQVDAFRELPSMIDQMYGVIKSDKAWELERISEEHILDRFSLIVSVAHI